MPANAAPVDRARRMRLFATALLGAMAVVFVAALRLDSKVAVAPRAQLAEAAVDPAFYAVDRDQPKVAAQFECIAREQAEVGFGACRRGP